MTDPDIFQERVLKVPIPDRHYLILVAPDGNYLGVDQDGFTTTYPHANDRIMWDESGAGSFRHVLADTEIVKKSADGDGCQLSLEGTLLDGLGKPTGESAMYNVAQGPEKLPSEYLQFFRENGWVCLTSILSQDLVEALEKVACTDRFSHLQFDRSSNPFIQSSAIARTAAEPVSLWLIRQYMQTDDIRVAHTPGLAILERDDGKRIVQGWHSDYPYHWGVPAQGRVPTPSGETVLGVQRNVCVSPFTKVGGATAFKLGSHALDQGPPEQWGVASDHYQVGYRESHGLPYTGPDADIVEAPGGSIILYDSRTWHRAGVNRTDKKRAALLMAMTPMYVMPKNDTSHSYKAFLESVAYEELNERERIEVERLMVHQFIGPGGQYAIAPDRELTATLHARQQKETSY
tara:strand:- start:365 stop:1576 length:1212 start_codon:yes stop_codon:yes gene_type:complete